MFKKILKTFMVVIMLGGLTACVSEPRQIFPDVTFTHLPGIQMAVSDITIEQRYKSPMTAEYAEHRIPLNPQTVMARWPGDRIAQTGGEASATFIIMDASVKEYGLDTDGNFTAYFTDEQALRYEATAEAMFQVSSHDGNTYGKVRARVTRSVTVPENASLNERDKILFNLITALTREFDVQMEQEIRTHLGAWLP